MTQRIIYKNDDGCICVIIPTQEAIAAIGITLIAQKDVPAGYSYKIINQSELPDPTFRDAWEIDDSLLTDGVGADFGVGSDNAVIAYTEKSVIIAPVINNVVDYTKQNEVNV